ncbi:hypothetical protein M569_09220, partial [Genlisea aurea]
GLTSIGLRWSNRRSSCFVRAKSSMAGPAATTKSKVEINVFESEEDLAVSLADYTADLSKKVCGERDSFTVVLSGGSLVKSLRKLVETPALFESVDWAKWHVFWVDERVVKKDHPDSNYLLAHTQFLSKVPIPSSNVYAINDSLSAEGAADEYEATIKHLVNTEVIRRSGTGGGLPKFDLILLGMGPDGHVASLFPDHRLLGEDEKWVSHIGDSPKPPPERITFTLPVINSAADVAVVVVGSGKADAVSAALGDLPVLLPVKLVSPTEGGVSWFLDKGAASKL